MAALEFYAEGPECRCACGRSAKYSMHICGFPVLAENPYTAKGTRQGFCTRCRKRELALWKELAESTPSKAVEQAIGALRGSESERVRAVWELRGYGFSAAQITAEVRKVALEREAIAA